MDARTFCQIPLPVEVTRIVSVFFSLAYPNIYLQASA